MVAKRAHPAPKTLEPAALADSGPTGVIQRRRALEIRICAKTKTSQQAMTPGRLRMKHGPARRACLGEKPAMTPPSPGLLAI
jgi:hypothetical protein